MTFTIEIPDALGNRLHIFAAYKSVAPEQLIESAIATFVEEEEEYYSAEQALREFSERDGEAVSLDEVIEDLKEDDGSNIPWDKVLISKQ